MLGGRASEGSAEHENPEEAHGVGSLHPGLFRVRRRGDLCRRGRGSLRGIALRLVWCCVRRNSALSPVRLGRLTELLRIHLPRTRVNKGKKKDRGAMASALPSGPLSAFAGGVS